MPKFKVGDKIEFEMDGKKVSGTITRDYNSPDHAMYDVRVGTKTMTIADTPMHPANACKNALKVGDKVTYWVFDKKLNGSVKAVRGESVDIDDGHGGVVTFKAKDLEVWNSKACKNAKFIKGDFVRVKGWPGTFRIDIVNPDGTYVLKKYPSGQPTIGSYKESELELEEANSRACNSRNPIVAKALNACASNGKFSEYPHFLWLAPWSDKAIMAGEKYQRTAQDLLWDGANLLRGKTKAVVQKAYDALRKAGIPDEELNVGYKPIPNACGTARNAKFIGRPPARVKQLIEQMEKILEVTDPNDTTDRMMGEVSSLGWSWDDSRRAWVYDDTDIKTDIKWAFKKFLEAVSRSDLERAVDNISDKAMANDFKAMLKIAQKYAR